VGRRNRGVEKQKRKAFKIYPSPHKKFALRIWGNWGPQRPKQKKNASVWEAKINRPEGRGLASDSQSQGSEDIKSRNCLRRRQDAVIALAMSAGDLKENKKPFFEATRKKRFVIFWCLPAYHNIFCLTSLHNDVM